MADQTLTPEAARERISQLTGDKEWGAKFLAGDTAAKRELDMLNDISVGRPVQSLPAAETREGAKVRIDALTQDKDFGAKVLNNPGGSEARLLDHLQHIAAGMTPESTPQRPPTDQEKAIAGLQPPADPSKYDFGFGFNEGPKTPEDFAQVKTWQEWLHAGGASADEAPMYKIGVDYAMRTFSAMDGAQLDHQAAECRAELERTYGAALPEKIAVLDQWIERIDRQKPGFHDLIIGRKLFLSAPLVKMAIGLAERRK